MEPDSYLWKVGKILAKQENLSRREAERWIEAGLVYHEGELIQECRERLHKETKLTIKQHPDGGKTLPQPVTILYHKPLGQLSAAPKTKNYPLAQESIEEDNYVGSCLDAKRMQDILAHKEQLRCCGRLDIHSKGLLLLSSDMTVVRALLNSDKQSSPIPKIYIVRAKSEISHQKREQLSRLKEIEGQLLLPFSLQWIDSHCFKLTLYEGKKHQIRKMLQAIGHEAAKIKRVAIGPFTLGSLPKGHWTLAQQDKIEELLNSLSSKLPPSF